MNVDGVHHGEGQRLVKFALSYSAFCRQSTTATSSVYPRGTHAEYSYIVLYVVIGVVILYY